MAGGRVGGQLDDGTVLLAAGAVAVAALGGATLLAAQVAGVLSGHGWVTSGASVPETFLGSLLQGPASVYRPAPPAWLFYALTTLFVAAAVTVLVRLMLRFGGGGVGGAQWGNARTENQLSVPQNPGRRRNQLTAGRGRRTRKIVAAAPNISMLAFGVPGSSKTTGLVLPNAAEWQGPLVITTTKASDLDAIYAARAALGPVWIIAPAGLPGRTTHRWSPVDYCVDARAADRMAAWLAEASASGADQRAAAWVDQAKSVLKGVLLAAHLSGGGLKSMRTWLDQGKDAMDHVRAVLIRHGYEEVAADYASPWLRLHDDGVGSIQFTLNVIARVYADEEVRESAAATDFTTEELIDRCGTVALIAPQSDADRLAPLLTSIIAATIHGAETRYNVTGKPLDPALGIMVDEAGNMLKYPRLPNILTTGRGMGIVVLTVWHDLSQLRESIGQRKAGTVLSGSGMRVLLPGCGDLETLQYFSGLLGKTQELRTTHSSQQGGSSASRQPVDTDLAPTDFLQQQEDFTAIAQYSNNRPLKLKMRLTYRDRDLRSWLARELPAPDVPTARTSLDKKTTTH